MDKIILSDIKVMATHGVNPEEKQEKQPFNISIICYLDTTQASIDDDISATINYAELYQQIIQEVETTSFNSYRSFSWSFGGNDPQKLPC